MTDDESTERDRMIQAATSATWPSGDPIGLPPVVAPYIIDALLAAGFGDVRALTAQLDALAVVNQKLRDSLAMEEEHEAERDSMADELDRYADLTQRQSDLLGEIAGTVSSHWRGVPLSTYDLQNVVMAYVAGRDDTLAGLRAALASQPTPTEEPK